MGGPDSGGSVFLFGGGGLGGCLYVGARRGPCPRAGGVSDAVSVAGVSACSLGRRGRSLFPSSAATSYFHSYSIPYYSSAQDCSKCPLPLPLPCRVAPPNHTSPQSLPLPAVAEVGLPAFAARAYTLSEKEVNLSCPLIFFSFFSGRKFHSSASACPSACRTWALNSG